MSNPIPAGMPRRRSKQPLTQADLEAHAKLVEAVRKCAAEGMSRAATARFLDVPYTTIFTIAQANEIAFAKAKPGTGRAAQIAAVIRTERRRAAAPMTPEQHIRGLKAHLRWGSSW